MRAALGVAALTAAAIVLTPRRAGPPRRSRPLRRGNGCRVVVLGAGFGGLSAAMLLSRNPDVELTVIDTQNHHLFQPLLYQVATAALSASDIASPIRGVLPENPRVRVLMETVTGIDTARQEVVCGPHRVPYDELIVATGSKPSYFGHGEWADAAPGLKTMADALRLRNDVLGAFEESSIAETQAERDRLLTFVLIGAGPTGVEMAGSIAELAAEVMATRHDARRARIVLVEAGPRVLPELARDLSANALRVLRGLEVEIRTGTKVTGIEPGVVHLDGHTIEAATIVWTAGTAATEVAEWLGVEAGTGGRVAVDRRLRVPGHPRVQVIGDAALALNYRGKPLPGLAPVAKQQGAYAAKSILRRLQGRRPPPPFRYADYGTLAAIGRNQAVAQMGPLHLTGLPGWLTWAGVHIFFLIGFRNRFMVGAQWGIAYLTNDRGGQLIVRAPAWQDRPARLSIGQPPVANPG